MTILDDDDPVAGIYYGDYVLEVLPMLEEPILEELLARASRAQKSARSSRMQNARRSRR